MLRFNSIFLQKLLFSQIKKGLLVNYYYFFYPLEFYINQYLHKQLQL